MRSTALGYSAKANNDFDVAVGSHSETNQVVNVSSVEIGGTTYEFAGSEATGAVSFGGGGSSSLGVTNIKRQLQNVAAGQVSVNSTDAVNGSQLYAAYQAIDNLNNTKVDKNNNTVVIGAGAEVAGDSGVAVCRLTKAAGGSVAVGVSSVASGGLSVAMGYGSKAQEQKTNAPLKNGKFAKPVNKGSKVGDKKPFAKSQRAGKSFVGSDGNTRSPSFGKNSYSRRPKSKTINRSSRKPFGR